MTGGPQSALEQTLEAFLHGFRHPAKLLVAVSGGSDSTGLMLALADAIASGRHPDFSLIAVTVDHALRSGSDREAEAVAALCARHGIEHHICRWEGPKPQTGLQAAARDMRYDLLRACALECGAAAILTGHTADDQDETIRMRAARGEGPGLAGMADAVLLGGIIWVMRPLLSLRRAAIRDYLVLRGESWTDDPSNENPRFERARLRSAGRAQAPGHHDSAETGKARHQAAIEAAQFLERHVRVEASSIGVLNEQALRAALDAPSGWRAVLQLAAVLGGRPFALDRDRAKRVRDFLESGMLSRITAGGVVFDRRSSGLYLYREARGILPATVPVGGSVLWDGRFLVENRGQVPAIVEANADSLADGETTLPDGVWRRAAKALPRIRPVDAGAPVSDVLMTPVLSPYLRYLPRFDLALADALADRFGLARHPALPDE